MGDDDRNVRFQANLKKEEGKNLEPKREAKREKDAAPASDSDSSSDKKKKKKKKEKKKKKKKKTVVKEEPEDSDDEWVELPIAPGSKAGMLAVIGDDDDDDIGPQ